MKKAILFTALILINFYSFSSREDTLSVFKVLDETMISELEKQFKVKFIKTIDIHEFSDNKFNSLLTILRKNKNKFWCLKITSPKLGNKYKKLLEFTIKGLSINSFNFKSTINYPVWINDFKVSYLNFKLSNGDELKNIDFSKFNNLEILKIKAGYLPENTFKPISKLRFLTELDINIGVEYDFEFLLKELKNLKKLSANLNKTYLFDLPFHYCLEEINAYDADIYFVKKIKIFCFLKRMQIHTKLDIPTIKKIIKSKNCNPFIAFYKNGYSENDYIAKKIKYKKLKKPNPEDLIIH